METWECLGGSWITAPVVVRTSATAAELFVVGTDHRLYAGRLDAGALPDLRSVGGLMLCAPYAVAADGRTDILTVSPDSSVCHRSTAGGRWSPWRPLGAVAGGVNLRAPRAARHGDRLDVVALTSTLVVQHRYLTGDRWTPWTAVPGMMFGAPELVSTAPGTLDVVALGSGGRLHHAGYRDGAWSPFSLIGAERTTMAPALVCPAGRMELYHVGLDRMLHLRRWQGGWGEPVCLEGTIIEPPAVVARPDGAVDIFVVGEDRSIWHRTVGTAAATWWTSLGGQAFSAIGVGAQPGRVDLFVLGRDSALWRRSFLR